MRLPMHSMLQPLPLDLSLLPLETYHDRRLFSTLFLLTLCCQVGMTQPPRQSDRPSDGDGSVRVSGEMKMWHKVTLDLSGPYAHESDNAPNPFTDYRMSVTFKHRVTETDMLFRVTLPPMAKQVTHRLNQERLACPYSHPISQGNGAHDRFWSRAKYAALDSSVPANIDRCFRFAKRLV